MTWRGSARPEFRRAVPSGSRRRLGVCAAIGVTVALGLGLTSCADAAALGLVHQACHDVSVSLVLYRESQREPDPKLAARDLARAETQLENASPLATEAAGEAPQWQALMATLAETSRLPEANLMPALQAQCAAAQTGGPALPAGSATTLPAAPGDTAQG